MSEPTKPEAVDLSTLTFHPLAEMFPLIGDEELKELADDIKKHGLLEQITMFEDKVLDGRNRIRALRLLGDTHCPRVKFREMLCHLDPRAYVISENIRRRHLSPDQRRDVIAALLKANPSQSNRAIAATAKVDDKTVAAVRTGLEASAEIPQLPTTTGQDGRRRKARRGVKGGSGTNRPPKLPVETITYGKVTDARTASNAYTVLEQNLLDALEDLANHSSFAHADEYAQRTIEKLQEKLGEMQPQEEGEQEAVA